MTVRCAKELSLVAMLVIQLITQSEEDTESDRRVSSPTDIVEAAKAK